MKIASNSVCPVSKSCGTLDSSGNVQHPNPHSKLHSIISNGVNKPITMFMIMISVVVIGVISLKRIPLLYLPEFSGSSLWIDIAYLSSSPEEIERLITIPVEDAVGTIENLESISSTSTANNASIGLRFKIGSNMHIAAMQVMNRIDEIKTSLPDDIERIRIRRFRSGDLPVIEFQVGGNIETETLYYVVEKVIKRHLQRIEGVAAIETRGIDEKQIFVELDQERLRSHGVDAYSLRNILISSNVNLSAGTIVDEGLKYTVRTIGDFKTVKDIEELPVPITDPEIENRDISNQPSAPSNNPQFSIPNPQSPIPNPQSDKLPTQIIRLNDLSDIQYDLPKKTRFRRLQGKDAVTVSVIKTSNANTIAVAKDVKKALKELESDHRVAGLEINIYRDRAKPVIKSLTKLRNAGLVGGTLVIIILFLFLKNIRSTVIVVGAIPLSILGAFSMMFVLRRVFNSDITINVISLSGIMLAIGILVDPAIVVLENIFRHKSQRNLPAKQAAISGASEVGLAIIAATATTISVFTPLLFLSKNRMGIFLHDFGVTVCITVIASLFVAITLIPFAASRFLSKNKGETSLPSRSQIPPSPLHSPLIGGNKGGCQSGVSGNLKKGARGNLQLNWIMHNYINLIHVTLRRKWITVGIATIIVIISVFVFKQLDRKIIWSTPYRETRIWIDTPRDYDIKETETLFNKLEGLLNRKKTELEITTISSNFEKDGGMLEAYLKPKEKATLSIETVRERIKALFPLIPGVKYRGARRYGYGPASNSISIELYGKNINTLTRLADKAKNKLEAIPYIKEVDTNLQSEKYEIQVSIKREKARMYGISPQRVAFGLKGALSSRAVSTLKSDDKEVNITFQTKEEDRNTLEKLKNITFKGTDEDHVTVDRVAFLKHYRSPRAIERQDRRPTITLSMNYKDIGYKKIKKDISMVMNHLKLPPDYRWNMGGQYRHYGQEEKELYFGLLLAIIIIYLIMASLFESFVYPFTIMLSIPFAFTGVAFIFYLMDVPLDDFAQIGMLLLSGIVVNNAIVLIDYINKLRNSGMEKKEAILKGVTDRFRPIFMTSITTILGLLPMILPMLIPQLFGQLEGRERMWAPLGLVIVAGLTTSTILTLVILPTFYSLIDDLAKMGKRLIKVTS